MQRLGDQRRLGELLAGQVDADRQALAVGVLGVPALHLAAGLAQDPLADLDDQAGLLGAADELAGHDEAAGRVVPAQQRLEAGDPLALEVDHRLVVDLELAALDRPPEVALEGHLGDGLGVHVGVEQLVAALAAALGAVHRGVGVAQDVLRALVAEGAPGDADADRGVDLLLAQRDRVAQLGEDPVGDADRVARVLHVRQEDPELVAGQARERVVGADALLQQLGEGDQQAVADRVAEAVVDVLEAVEVEAEDGEGGAALADAGEGRVEVLPEGLAVGEAGQRVVQRVVAGALLAGAQGDLGAAAAGDVAGDDLDAGDLAVGVAQRDDGRGEEHVLAGVVDHLLDGHGDAALHDLLEAGVLRGAQLLVLEQVVEGLADQVVDGGVEDVGDEAVGVDDRAALVEADQQHVGGLDEELVLDLALLQGALDLAALADVDQRHHHAAVAALVGDGGRREADPKDISAGGPQADRGRRLRLAGLQAAAQRRLDRGERLAVLAQGAALELVERHAGERLGAEAEQALDRVVRHRHRAPRVDLEDPGRHGLDQAQHRRVERGRGRRLAEVVGQAGGLADEPGVGLDERRVDAVGELGVDLEPAGARARVGDEGAPAGVERRAEGGGERGLAGGARLRVGGEREAAADQGVPEDRFFGPGVEAVRRDLAAAQRLAVGRQGAGEGGGVVEGGEDVARREAAAGQRQRVLDEAGAGPAERQQQRQLLEGLGQRVLEVGVAGRVPEVGERVGASERRLEERGQVAEPLLDLRAQGGELGGAGLGGGRRVAGLVADAAM